MVRILRKRTLFFLSILVTGLLGILGNYIRTNYSKDDSLLVSIAKADLQAYDWTGYSDPSGDGCGGCSGGDSGY